MTALFDDANQSSGIRSSFKIILSISNRVASHKIYTAQFNFQKRFSYSIRGITVSGYQSGP